MNRNPQDSGKLTIQERIAELIKQGMSLEKAYDLVVRK